jgi:hypothetical protein
MRFKPSVYTGYGASGGDIAADTARVTVATAGGLATGATVAGSTAVTGLLTAAGVSAAAVPIVGWIVGGVIAAAAGTVALVAAVKGGKVRRAEAIEIAKKLGLSEPEKAPGFIVRALKIPKDRRKKLAARLKKRAVALKKRKRLGKPGQKRLASLVWKLRILDGIDRAENPRSADDRKAVGMVTGQRRSSDPVTEANSPAAQPEAEDAVESAEERTVAAPTGFVMPTWGWAAVAGGVAILVAAVAARRPKGK